MVLLMIIMAISSTLTGLTGVDGKINIDPTPPEDYHPGYVHLNVTEMNGTPADGFMAVHYNNRLGIFERSLTFLDQDGSGTIKVRFDRLGACTMYINDHSSTRRYFKEHYLEPDQHLFLNITLDPAPAPYNTVTGTVRSGFTGEPLVGHEVQLRGETDQFWGFTMYNTTDAQGRYLFNVPNVTHEIVSLYSPSTPELYGQNEHFFMFAGTNHYSIDLVNPPRYYPEVLTKVRYVIEPEGVPLFGSFSHGIRSVENRFLESSTTVSGPDGQGWYEFNSTMGEGQVRIRPNPDLFPNVTLDIYTSYVHNGTPMDMEVPVNKDFMVPVQLNVTNSSQPLPGVQTSYYYNGRESFGIYYTSCNNLTDANGSIEVWMPKGALLRIGLRKVGFEERRITVDTTGTAPYEYSVEMEPLETVEDPPMTNLTVTVIDDETGLPVPAARISGYHELGYNYRMEEYTDDNGIWEGEVYSGSYSYMNSYTGLGDGQINDVEVPAGQESSITIRQSRDPEPEEPELGKYHLYLKDVEGEPVPNATLRLGLKVSKYSHWGTLFTSDETGRIDIRVVQGSEVDVSPAQKLDSGINQWAPVRSTITAPLGGGALPDITVYRRTPFSSINGFIRDSVTNKGIPEATVKCSSVEEVQQEEGPTRPLIHLEEYKDGAEFLYLASNSMGDGYYRTWAANTGLFRVEVPGYFPYETKIETSPVRGEFTHDVFLDPLVEERAWINGTLVDQYGDPISGFLNITDIDHPAMGGIDIEINESGEFSVETYTGNFLLRYFNDTLEDSLELNLTSSGVQLLLPLIPHSMIGGTVQDSAGDPVPGINVTLHRTLFNGTEPAGWNITDDEGNFSFSVTEGEYTIIIKRTELFDRYESSGINVNGWNDWYGTISLTDRTQADVLGTVVGSGGPYIDGVPDVNIVLYDGEDAVANTRSGIDGDFHIKDVDHGNYTLYVEPPMTLRRVEGRSGYLDNTTFNFTVSGAVVEVYPILEYVHITPQGYVNVTYNNPNGTDVFLDAPIYIEFSEVMDQMMVENSIYVTPTVGNLTFIWDGMGYFLTIDHVPFEPDTTYTVMIGAGASSVDGWPIWDGGFSWDFTTGESFDPWEIFEAEVYLDGMDLNVEVYAPVNLSIYICILDVDYFQLMELNGTYMIQISGDSFEHETTYGYFFTDKMNGDDKAPRFSDSFTTPMEPHQEPEWEIFEAEVSVTDSSGDWEVEVTAVEGISIYIVIEDVGSFKLTEGPPGIYKAVIEYHNFEEGRTYNYHFSDAENGEDLAPSFSGSATTPVFGDDEGWFSNRTCCTVCLISIVAILLLIIVMILISKSRKDDVHDLLEE